MDLVNSVQQDEKDGDVDVKIEIAPNNNEQTFGISKAKQELAPGTANKELGILKSDSISNRSGTLEGTGTKLAANVGTSSLPSVGTRSNYQAHHIIATSSADRSDVAKAASQSGYDINRSTNGIWLPNDENICEQVNLPLHKGNHLHKYFRTVDLLLDSAKDRALKAKNKNKPWDESMMLRVMSKTENHLKSRLINLKDPLRLQKKDPLKPKDPNPEKRTF